MCVIARDTPPCKFFDATSKLEGLLEKKKKENGLGASQAQRQSKCGDMGSIPTRGSHVLQSRRQPVGHNS